MRQRWRRLNPEIRLERAEIVELLRPIFPRAAVIAAQPVHGGLANTNLKIAMRDRRRPILLRLYQRGIDQAAKEVALIRRLAGRVPVPDLLHFSADNPVTGHPCAVMEWIEAERLDRLALKPEGIEAAACSVGQALAGIHAVGFERCGFLGADLEVSSALDFDRDGLLAFIRNVLLTGPGADRLGGELTDALIACVERKAGCLAEWAGPCLVHGDFNGSNILVRASPDPRWPVAAILDWEFALSGTPGFDFAQLLRLPLARHRSFGNAVGQSYRAAGRILPDAWRDIARMTDLFAWVDMLSRADPDPELVADARATIRATAGLR